jgi:gluconolactonase
MKIYLLKIKGFRSFGPDEITISMNQKLSALILSNLKNWGLTLIFTLIGYTSMAQNKANAAYPYDPASQPQKGIEAGEIIERKFSDSKIYPGTERTYWIYIPSGYTPEKQACLYVCMDGMQYNATTVFDNLIATGEMPMTIGVFVGSGVVAGVDNKILRFNRSNEFDKTDDTFVRFLVQELLVDAELQKTKNGRAIHFSKDANDRAIAGGSSGAICAFTAGWQRPDVFSRVFSSIGTYVAMRGGNEYQALIRKTEPKPIRIYLEDGINDTWNPLFGNWYEANLLMESALNFAGYELTHTWGRGAHDGVQATHIFPDVMRWLWKGWPARVTAGTSLNDMLTTILIKDAAWKDVAPSVAPLGELFSDKTGNIIFQNQSGVVCKLDSSREVTQIMTLPAGKHLIGTDGDGLYIADSRGTISYKGNRKESVIATGIPAAKSLLVTSENDIYISEAKDDKESKLWLIKPGQAKQMISRQPNGGTYMAIYPNHKLLMQTEKHSNWIYSYLIDKDGTLIDGQRFYWLHNSDNFILNQTGNMTFDRNGNMSVASEMGIQICDQNGRVRSILTLPTGRISSLKFGGTHHDILYVVSGGKLFSRKLSVVAVEPWMSPIYPDSQGGG